MIRRLLVFVLCLITVILFCAVSGIAQAEDKCSKLTVMLYLCGGTLESDGGAATKDIEEIMANLQPDADVNVIMMASGATIWESNISSGETSIYELGSYSIEKVYQHELSSMGDPQTLSYFLNYGYKHYPAEQYALIFWDHGAGPLRGVCFDELFSNDNILDGLTLYEIQTALSKSPFSDEKLSWLGFDACLMASLETACMIAPYAQYMIASEELEPVTGWSYEFLKGIEQDRSGAETGRRIVQAYADTIEHELAPTTLSCIDLSKISAIAEEINGVFRRLQLVLTAEAYTTLALCRANAKGFGRLSYEYDLVDLIDLLQEYETAGVAECGYLIELVNDAVISQVTNMPYVNGLSIYYPYHNKEQYNSTFALNMLPAGERLNGYASFISDVASIWLGVPIVSWESVPQLQAETRGDDMVFSCRLTPEQAKNVSSASLMILEKVFGGAQYQFAFETDQVVLQDNVLQAVYRGEAMYIVDDLGNPLLDSVFYEIRDNAYVLNAVLYKSENERMLAVNMVYSMNEQNQMDLIGIYDAKTHQELRGKTAINLEEWDIVYFVNPGKDMQYSDFGILLPYDEWTSGPWLSALGVENRNVSWYPAFLNMYDRDERYALMEIVDTQNNTICSTMIPIGNPNYSSIFVEEKLLEDNAYCRLSVVGIRLISGQQPVLQIEIRCENKTEETVYFIPNELTLNGIMVNENAVASQRILPFGSDIIRFDYALESLMNANVDRIEDIGVNISAETVGEYKILFKTEALIRQEIDIPTSLRASEE